MKLIQDWCSTNIEGTSLNNYKLIKTKDDMYREAPKLLDAVI